MEPCQDPSNPLNAPEYRTGKPCIEKGCDKPAGTAWSPFWCQACNAKRLTHISSVLQHEVDRFAGKVPKSSEPPKRAKSFAADA